MFHPLSCAPLPCPTFHLDAGPRPAERPQAEWERVEIGSALPEDPEMQAVVQQFLDTLGALGRVARRRGRRARGWGRAAWAASPPALQSVGRAQTAG